MCTVLLPPGNKPIAVDKYIIYSRKSGQEFQPTFIKPESSLPYPQKPNTRTCSEPA